MAIHGTYMRLTPLVLACRLPDYEGPGQRQAKGGEPYTQSYLAEPGLTYGLIGLRRIGWR